MRQKMKVIAIVNYESGNNTVEFQSVEDTDTPPADKFSLGAPNGTATLVVDNPANVDSFKPGELYNVDFTLTT